VKFTQFPLHPDTPEEGLSLEQLFAGRNIDIQAAKARMTGLMLEEGLAYGDRTMTYNSRLAQELAKWAEGSAEGEDIHDALFRAYFEAGVNIARIDELVLIAERAGLASAEARDVLESRRYKARAQAKCRKPLSSAIAEESSGVEVRVPAGWWHGKFPEAQQGEEGAEDLVPGQALGRERSAADPASPQTHQGAEPWRDLPGGLQKLRVVPAQWRAARDERESASATPGETGRDRTAVAIAQEKDAGEPGAL